MSSTVTMSSWILLQQVTSSYRLQVVCRNKSHVFSALSTTSLCNILTLCVSGINGDICGNFFGLCVSNLSCAIWSSCVRAVFYCMVLELRMCVLPGLNGARLGPHAAGRFIMMGGQTSCLWVWLALTWKAKGQPRRFVDIFVLTLTQ